MNIKYPSNNNFIKLHKGDRTTKNKYPVYVNKMMIALIEEEDETHITTFNGYIISVTETAEEVLKLIN